jgi:hypothetical protein
VIEQNAEMTKFISVGVKFIVALICICYFLFKFDISTFAIYAVETWRIFVYLMVTLCIAALFCLRLKVYW